MINKNTVLVLGAGASKPFGLPTGKELKNDVCRLLGESNKIELLADLNFCTDMTHCFGDMLRKSAFASVDAFVEHNTKFMDLGKAAIAMALLPRENSSSFYGEDNWYQHLFQLMVKKCTFDTLNENKLSVITFNYDRSLEHYLYETLNASFTSKGDNEYAKKFSEIINIIHVHGSLGRLKWQTEEMCPFPQVHYGAPLTSDYIKCASESIKIIPETQDDTPEFIEAFDLLNNAARIYFLGFGYHDANLRRLKITSVSSGRPRDIRGTTMNISITTRDYIKHLKFLNRNHEIHLDENSVYKFLYKTVNLAG